MSNKEFFLIKKSNDYYLYDESKSWAIGSSNDRQRTPNGHKLSVENCNEISGVVDEAFYMNEYIKARHTQEECIGFIDGFNKAMELNKDKLFTLEEVHKLIRLVHILPNFELEQFEDENNVLQIDTFISHYIKQPMEIEVEIEQVLVQSSIQGEAIWRYKLDENLCLILKKL